jgi:S-adenosylmethionine-diacylglycerol 3-amino-3-carboxypropyl transferase
MGQAHFNGLIYTLANEDSIVESELLPNHTERVIAIAGSGSRIIPLLAKFPQELVCVDLSLEQLYLTELRIESVRHLEHHEFIQFFGYPTTNSSAQSREALFKKLVNLNPEAQNYFLNLFKNISWNSLLYSGKWEQTVRKFSKVIRKFVGQKGLKIFDCKTLEEQKEYYFHHFPQKSWHYFLRIYAVLMAITWKIKPGIFPQVEANIRFYQTYKKCFDQMFMNTLAKENYMLQLVFFGEIMFPEALPTECDPVLFQQAKKALITSQVSYIQEDIISTLEKSKNKNEFISFSNAPSYFPQEMAKNYLGRIASQLSESATIVIRNFLNDPTLVCLNGFTDVSEQYSDILAKEITKTYEIQIIKPVGK